MKTSLKVGEKIFVKIEEVAFDGSLIVEFAGMLFRVINLSNQTMKPGDRVFLTVKQENPIEFQLDSSKRIRNQFKLDRQV